MVRLSELFVLLLSHRICFGVRYALVLLPDFEAGLF